jgi:hypothetical protein
MANVEAQILSLIKKIDKTNPEVALAMEQLTKQFYALERQVNPLAVSSRIASGATAITVDDVTNFAATITPTNVRFSWDAVDDTFQYEIRQGTVWATATSILISSTRSANFTPQVLGLTYGLHTFLIKAINSSGYSSTTEASTAFTVTSIGLVDLTGSAIQNVATIDWETPASIFEISYYKAYKDGVLVGTIAGTFIVISVRVEGLYEFTIVSVDIVGNESSPSPGVTLKLLQPENYVLYNSLTADYSGTYSNSQFYTYLGIAGIVGPITVQTWDQHFTTNVWNTPQEQITAGLPKYIQPSTSPGYYEEEFDLGSVLDNFTATLNYTLLTLAGTISITSQISSSVDNITWTTPEAGPSVYFASGRYIRVRWILTALNAASVGFLSSLFVDINIQFSTDQGEFACLSTDVGGTEITYNKAFVTVTSVVGTAVATSEAIVVTDSISGASFLALVFDKDGTRISETISWQARGTL